jgi:hypothetical protein
VIQFVSAVVRKLRAAIFYQHKMPFKMIISHGLQCYHSGHDGGGPGDRRGVPVGGIATLTDYALLGYYSLWP